MSQGRYIPRRGDIIYIDFEPQAGREIYKRRPAVVLSLDRYNESGLAVVCPITSNSEGRQINRPFKVPIPPGFKVQGVILADQVKSLDWKERDAVYVDQFPNAILHEVLRQIIALFTGRYVS